MPKRRSRIIMTNLCPDRKKQVELYAKSGCGENGKRILDGKNPVWQIIDSRGRVYQPEPHSQEVLPDDSVIWTWKVPYDAAIGIHRIEVDVDLEKRRELPTKIQVLEPMPGQKTLDSTK